MVQTSVPLQVESFDMVRLNANAFSAPQSNIVLGGLSNMMPGYIIQPPAAGTAFLVYRTVPQSARTNITQNPAQLSIVLQTTGAEPASFVLPCSVILGVANAFENQPPQTKAYPLSGYFLSNIPRTSGEVWQAFLTDVAGLRLRFPADSVFPGSVFNTQMTINNMGLTALNSVRVSQMHTLDFTNLDYDGGIA